MAELSEDEFRRALDRGKIEATTEPRAKSVRYDRRSRRVVVNLTNGSVFAFPARLVQGLDDVSDDDLAAVVVEGAGFGLRWSKQDIDISIPGLLAGVFGTRSHMARLAGRTTSVAKAEAARANGAKGGRPRKSA